MYYSDHMASPDPDRYTSEQARYVLLNLHPAAAVERLSRLFTGVPFTRLIEVIGPAGSGRRYVVEAAAYAAGRKSVPVTVIPLDFDGAEPDRSLASYVALAMAKAEAAGSASAAFLGEIAAQLASDPIPCDYRGVLAVALCAALELPVTAALEYARNPDTRLGALLGPAIARGPLVLHVSDAVQLDRASRKRLLNEAALEQNLFVSLAHETPPPADRNSERIFISPWTQEEMRERIRERFAPSAFPNEFIAVLWESGEGRAATAATLQRLLSRNAIRQDGFGAWNVPRDWRKYAAVTEELAHNIYDPVDTALTSLSEEDEIKVTAFLRLAALCHPSIPVNLLLAAAGVDPDTHSDFLDECVDEPLGTEGPAALFEDLGYSHPGFAGNLLTYRFRDPAMPAAILTRMPARARDALAQGLLSFADEAIPPLTKAAARLRLRILSHLDHERERERAEHLLAWWTGAGLTGDLREELVAGMHDGHFSPGFLWTLFQQTENRWAPYRRLVLLDAFEQQPGGVSRDTLLAYLSHRIPLLLQLGETGEAAILSRRAMAQNPAPADAMVFQTFEGRAMLAAGDIEAARSALSAALASAGGYYEPVHPLILSISNDLARCHSLLGASGEAEEIWRRIVPQLQEAGLTLPALEAASSLGQAVLAQGRHAEARNILEHVAAAGEQMFGEGHPQTERAMELLRSLPEPGT